MAIRTPAATDELLAESRMAKVMKARANRRMEEAFLRIAAGQEGERRQWFALTTDNRAEKDVEKLLDDAGVTAWVPKRKTLTVRRGTRARRERIEPIFSGYVFVRVVPCDEAFVGLGRVRGVAGIVAADGRAFPIRDKEMEALIGLVSTGWFDVKEIDGRLSVGSKVRIEAGRFAAFEGVMDGYVGKRAARVLTRLFGQEMAVTVPLAKLAKSD